MHDETNGATARPAAPRRLAGHSVAHLVVVHGRDTGRVYDLQASQCRIGRAEAVEVQILDAGISRRHALITRCPDGQYQIQDEGSCNGTFANNDRVAGARPLSHGDRIQVGVSTVLKFARAPHAGADPVRQTVETTRRDALTGVLDRHGFKARLAAELAHARRYDLSLALLLLDLDNFKAVNDGHGRAVGDAVLAELGALLSRITREDDAVARPGDDAFAVICRNTDLVRASILGQRIRSAVSSTVFAVEGLRVPATVSIGAAAVPDPTLDSADAMVRAAGDALQAAQESGGDRVLGHRTR